MTEDGESSARDDRGTTPSRPDLAHLTLEDPMTDTGRPVVFIHGLWLHATSWQPWVELFERAGYAASAPGWPGIADTVEGARADPDAIADHGIDDVVEHYLALFE